MAQYEGPPYVLSGRKEYGYNSALGTIPPEADDFFDRLSWAAGWTWDGLVQGWERRRRPNYWLDLLGLQGALELDKLSTDALEDPTIFLHANTNYVRYELFAGAAAVRSLIPIQEEERPALGETMRHYDPGQEKWLVEPSEHHAELIADWREWVRSDGLKRVPGDNELHGEASLLAAASYRIMHALHPSGIPGDDPDYMRLVAPVEREPWRFPAPNYEA